MHVRIIAILALSAVACGGQPATPAPEQPVSIGYGTRDRSRLTGAVTSVTAEEIRTFHYSRVEEMIEGRVPGVVMYRLPNGEYSIHIRGIDSYMANTQPLLVIDGVPVDKAFTGAALAALNPNDVARIDVLKDGASTAMWGSRGAGGVIVITSKRADD